MSNCQTQLIQSHKKQKMSLTAVEFEKKDDVKNRHLRIKMKNTRKKP